MKFGEYLIRKKIVSEDDVKTALAIQRFHKKPIGRVLRELSALDGDSLNWHLADFLNLQKIETIKQLELIRCKSTFSNVSNELESRFGVFVIGESKTSISYGCENFDDLIHEKLSAATGLDVDCYLINSQVASNLRKLGKSKLELQSNIEVHRNFSDDEKLAENSPYSILFKECLVAALKADASDIHIEPNETKVCILFRVYGDRVVWKELDSEHISPFLSKVKHVVNLPLATLGKASDSRARFPSLQLDLRCNVVKKVDGEKVVLRLLKQNRSFDLKDTGLAKGSIDSLVNAIEEQNGLILIAGPTGSGKTTTLYSLLHSVDRQKYNVSTIENPVEYYLAGVNHIDISDSGPMSFSDALRALMRQDPDVILVGEVRDEETAELCLKASSTGHTVVSTVHANGALEIIERLELLGIDRFSINSNLRLACAQRLLKKLCQYCSRPHKLAGHTGLKVQNENGCSKCRRGIVGRIAIMEFVTSSSIKNESNTKLALESNSLDEQALKLALESAVCASEIPLETIRSVNEKASLRSRGHDADDFGVQLLRQRD